MILRDAFFVKDVTVISCDADINETRKLRAVAVNGKMYEVISEELVNSISDILSLYIGIQGRHDFRHGDDLKLYY